MQDLPIYFYFLVLALSIAAMVWGADRFVNGAAGIASNLGLSPLIIGLTVVSFGTSAPEILVSASAAVKGSAALAVGNALGSNLANMGLVLAITALIFPLTFGARIAHYEIPIMLAVTLLAGAVLWNGYLGRLESTGLAICLLIYMIYLIKTAGNQSVDPSLDIHKTAWSRAIGLTAGGLIVLLVSANFLVGSASKIASEFGVSEMVIGITVVAVGTSLPELAASVAGALKGHSEMAVGNVVGSNIFNLAAVLPVAGIIRPSLIDETGNSLFNDYGPVLFISLLLAVICLIKIRGKAEAKLGRMTAGLMLALYISYYWFLFA